MKKKVKQEVKVRKEVQKNIMIDSQRRSPRRKADEETLYLDSDGETTQSNRTSAVKKQSTQEVKVKKEAKKNVMIHSPWRSPRRKANEHEDKEALALFLDLDADIDTAVTTETKLTKLVVKKVNEHDDEDEVWMEGVIDVLVEGQAHPNEHGINQVSTSSKAEDSTLTAASSATNFYKVMKDANVDSFAEMDQINPIVEMYEQRTGNHLRIKRSINGKFRVYQCREHINCPFEIRFARRRSDGMYVVSWMKTYHAEVHRAPLAANGRQWKTRCSSKNLNNAFVKVLKTKHDDVTARDIIRTMANKKPIRKTLHTSQHGVLSNLKAWQRRGWAARAFSLSGHTLRRLGNQTQGPFLDTRVCRPMSFTAFTSSRDL